MKKLRAESPLDRLVDFNQVWQAKTTETRLEKLLKSLNARIPRSSQSSSEGVGTTVPEEYIYFLKQVESVLRDSGVGGGGSN